MLRIASNIAPVRRRMVRLRMLVAALGAAALLVCAGQASPAQQQPAGPPAEENSGEQAESPQEPQRHPRVIVKVSRRLTIHGTLVSRDHELITFRDVKGELHSYPISRVLRVIELVEPKPGQTGVVFLADGQTREGIIIEDEYDHVLIEIEGIRAKLSRENVDHVVLEPTLEERYQSYKRQLLPGQTLRHFTLCVWLFENKQYELAVQELEELLDYEEFPEAKTLLNTVKAQLELQRGGFRTTEEQRAAEDDSGDPKNESKSGPVYAKDMLPQQLLTAEDVNIIRIYELDFENPPRVAISPDTIRTLIERYGTNPLMPASQADRTALFRADPIDIVRLMFELKARDLYPQIQVLSEPMSLNQFRQYVHDAWLINNCATSRCHGGPAGGRFFLHRDNSRHERVRYTNLLILDRLELDESWPLINYDDPMMSLVVQYALPRQVARKPHPAAQGWTPVFTRGNTRMLDESVKWIRAMYHPRPQYPVQYDPPILGEPVAQAPSPEAPPAGDSPQTDDDNPLKPAFGDEEPQPEEEPGRTPRK